MTEQEWMACTGPVTMLRFLRSKASGRKIRLFACACLRRIWPLLDRDEEARVAVETVEQFADGLVGKGAFDALLEASLSVVRATERPGSMNAEPFVVRVARSCASRAAGYVERSAYRVEYRMLVTARTSVLKAAMSAAKDAVLAVGASTFALGGRTKEVKAEAERRATSAERIAQCQLIRDLFGNPFRPVVVDPSWLTWNDRTVVKLAQGIYDERAFYRLPVLADALEEADCADAQILTHCRQKGEHVPGCWVVDLLLGKE